MLPFRVQEYKLGQICVHLEIKMKEALNKNLISEKGKQVASFA